MNNNQLEKNSLDDLALRLFRLGLHLVRHERGIAGGKGTLRIPKLSALAAVADAESVPVGTLAESEGVREPTMSITVSVLLDANLVQVVQDPDDERATRVLPTDVGAKRLSREKRRLAVLLRDAEVDEAGVAKAQEAVETLLAILADYRAKQSKRREARRARRTRRTSGE